MSVNSCTDICCTALLLASAH